MKKKLISLLCACTTAVCSIPAYAEAAEDPCNVTANGILWCNSVFDDSGLIAGLDTGFSGGIYDGDRYFVSTNLPPESWISSPSEPLTVGNFRSALFSMLKPFDGVSAMSPAEASSFSISFESE